MKKIFSILLSLALLVSLGAMATAPVMAADTLPSISPTSTTYNLDSPTQLVVGITWGDAVSLANVTNTGNGTLVNAGSDYFLFETLMVLTTGYLNATLLAVGATVTLQLNFDMGAYTTDCFLTITATGTDPEVSPASVNWSFDDKGNVTTAILWGIAANIVTVGDDASANITGFWSNNLTTLLIDQSYFTTRWPSSLNISQSVVLNIKWNRGNNATLTVKCVGTTTPSLSPTTVYFNYNVPTNVTSTLKWGPATAISKVRDVTYLVTPYEIVNPGNYTTGADNKTFTLLYSAFGPTWLKGLTFNYDQYKLGVTYKYLEVTFNDPAATKINLTLVIAPNLPSISPTTANWNLDNLDPTYLYVYTVPTLGDCTNVTKIVDQNGYKLECYNATKAASYLPGGACNSTLLFDYRVSYNPLIGVYVLSVWQCYFEGAKRTYANGTLMGLPPVLSQPGDSCNLTISFDKCGPVLGYCPTANFIVTAIGEDAAISPNKADFNLDAPANVTTSIDWGPWATDVDAITVGADTLSPSQYTVEAYVNATTPSTLNIAADYLDSVLEQPDDVVTMKIDFDAGADAVFTITAVGTPSCFIATAAGADAPQLDILREFRDKVMRPNSLGAELVSLYYKVSPSIAEVISDNDALKALVKGVLIDPIGTILTWSQGLWS